MNSGMDDVIAADTRLSHVDGEKGELIVSGLTLDQLTARPYQEVYRLLLAGEESLGRARVKIHGALRPLLPQMNEGRNPMEGVRLGLAGLPSSTTPSELVAAFPVLLAGAHRGARLSAPDPDLSPVEDLLRMFLDQEPTPDRVGALNTYLVTVCEHGMNASTFACRVVASTGAGPVEAALAALGALSGPLHGGAPGPVLDLIEEMGACADVRAALLEKVRRGERLMGFGHRIYRARDPRADALKGAVRRLNASKDLALAEKVEAEALSVLQECKPDRTLQTNVEFYTAVLLNEVGFPRSWFTPLFATGRILGWMAHYLEQRETGRLIRPKSRYVGKRPTVEV